MDFNFTYCPILKGKMNDIKAMSLVGDHLAAAIKPLYELPPFKPTDNPDQVLARFANRLAKNAGIRPCYVDFPLLKPGARTSDGSPALQTAYGQLNAVKVQFDPVYGFDRDESLWPLVIHQALHSGGMLLRLDMDDVEFAEETIDRIIDLRAQGLDSRMIDVMVDCRYLGTNAASVTKATEVADFVGRLAAAVKTRKTIVAGSSAPKTVTNISKDSSAEITRNELALWAILATGDLPVEIIYGDYGVIHPDFSDLVASPHINGKIRYTAGSSFHIFRGHSLRIEDKYDQYRTLSSAVVDSPIYQGNTYSHGDRHIYDCATGQVGTGNPGTWVLVDQNHHVSYAAQQIRKLSTLVGRGLPAEAVLESA